MGGGENTYDGKTERREGGEVSALIIYRVGEVEKKVEKLDDKFHDLNINFTGLKSELGHVAKSEGKLSGAIYGVASAVIVAIIGIILQKTF